MKRKGFALVASFLLLLVVFVLGLGFLGKRVSLYKEALSARSASQARAAALAGMEDARVKLEKDGAFPPLGSSEQQLFSYSEPLLSVGGSEVGGYTVTIDKRLQQLPYALIRVTSVGWSGTADSPAATRRLYAELDISPLIRGASDVNPNFFRWINWLDGASY
jgi:Na+-transporting methylmalonyl-CoA/oxaloacetate decarboxylase gamma subunit